MKKFIAAMFITVITIIMTTASVSAVDKIELVIDGIEVNANAVIVNSTTMVPVRFVSEWLAKPVSWDVSTKTVTIEEPALVDIQETYGGIYGDVYFGILTVSMKIGSNTAYNELFNYADRTEKLNSKTMKLNQPPVIIDGSTYVPIRFVAEIFDCEVDYLKDYVSGRYFAAISTDGRSPGLYHQISLDDR
ncbi:MAG: copper amine oxidase N-terminal domain-containing protein [Clostridiales Family XIII bacterium]|jgi:hypothetical protein|nr:copper amine oxidase N-terminal domain-containing protein [Clostridiales Family XIII bacterium]